MLYLGEDLVFVHGYHGSQGEGGDIVDHNAVGGSVAGKLLMRTNTLNFSVRFSSSLQLLLHCLLILPLHEGLSLGEEVAEQEGVVQTIP